MNGILSSNTFDMEHHKKNQKSLLSITNKTKTYLILYLLLLLLCIFIGLKILIEAMSAKGSETFIVIFSRILNFTAMPFSVLISLSWAFMHYKFFRLPVKPLIVGIEHSKLKVHTEF